jgi:hypothetical protein
MQILNHSLIPFPILTNHTPPTSSPYQPSALHVNVTLQPYTFSNPLWPCTKKTFSPFHSIGSYSCPWSNPQLIFISSTHTQLSPKVFCLTSRCQVTNQRIVRHQCYCQTSISSNANPYDHFNFIPSLAPPHLHQFKLGFHHWMCLVLFI